MALSNRILIYSLPETAGKLDHSILVDAGYDVLSVSQPQAVESWLKTFRADDLLIITHPSADVALRYCSDLLSTHPNLPILLVTGEVTQSYLKQALEIGLIDYLTFSVDPSALILSVQRGLAHQKNWQGWNRFARVLAGLKDGVILADLDGHLLTVNQSTRDIFRLEGDDPEGKLVNEVFHNTDLLDIFKPQITFPLLSEISLGDGRVFSAQASLIPEMGIAIIIQDITHLKELDRIKTDYVNTVSHDLRSPLTAIYGFAGLIDRAGSINEQQAEFIRHIQSSVQNITSMINDLMDLGRIEAGYDIQMHTVNLSEIIHQSVANLDYQVNEKMQELVLSIPGEVPGILGNPLHLQRMATNLIENAIKFTPPLGRINVRCTAEASQLILEIADNGPGIPLPDQPHIFDKFFRGSNLSQTTPGSGLGLSIVKSIVDRHHGRVWVESSPQGTTFTVILPVK